MDCEEFLEEYSDYLDWRLEAHPLIEYREHVSECRTCAEYDRVMRSGLYLVKSLDQPQAATDCLSRVQRRLHQLQSEVGRRSRDVGLALAAASVTAVAVLAIVWLPALRSDVVELPPVVVEQASANQLPSVFGPAPRIAPSARLLRVPDFSADGLLARPSDHRALLRAPQRATPEATAESKAAVTH